MFLVKLIAKCSIQQNENHKNNDWNEIESAVFNLGLYHIMGFPGSTVN